MKLKDDSVRLSGLHPVLAASLCAIDAVYLEQTGDELTITSGNDGQHKAGSRHYLGCAIDGRTWADGWGAQMSDSAKRALADAIAVCLDNRFGVGVFSVLVEETHLHIALKPDRPI